MSERAIIKLAKLLFWVMMLLTVGCGLWWLAGHYGL